MNTFSRFSVLAPEVDIDTGHKIRQNSKVESKDKGNHDSKCEKSQQFNLSKTANNVKPNKKKSKDNELHALAFGHTKGNKKKNPGNDARLNSKNSNKKANRSSCLNGTGVSQDDDWYKHDEMFVKEENEKALKEAILQSKLDYELLIKTREEDERESHLIKDDDKVVQQKPSNSRKKKKEKPLTLSLEQFNSLPEDKLENLKNGITTNENHEKAPPVIAAMKSSKLPSKKKFFNEVDEVTRRTIEKEERLAQYKEYIATTNKIKEEQNVEKLTEEIEKRDFEIQALRLEVDSLKTQLSEVKSRNKKLCEVISLSEMRSKGQLVIELEKVNKSRDEFSEAVTNITAELEQERTKVSQLTQELRKCQGKKRNADSSSK